MRTLITTNVGEAVNRLRAGGLVGLPTETVYGLAADATSASAVQRLYDIKGRPPSHPVIVHVDSLAAASAWARDWPQWAIALGETFWPGPLTLVVPRAGHVNDYLTGGQDTVGLRVPGHRVALQVLKQFGGGVAAPSANRFGRVSPTSARDVVSDLGDLFDDERDCILDGGKSVVGVESTIVDATGEAPRILRPGAVSAASIQEVTGQVVGGPSSGVRAPGMLASHYAPRADVVVVESVELVSALGGLGHARVGVLALNEQPVPAGVERLATPANADEFAAVLYAALRRADERQLTHVVVVPPPDLGIGVAIRDRLSRAATHRAADSPS